ncbi:probable ubiquitin-conjugating enzyme E2 25 isoform X7 [Cucumis melo]|uniref:Probable ubiquitin-conjugating enzyme E2 25 isoform X7 n=1 Tax=Cucumis melo TaxID=3656 RepID=A0ABM3L1G7_CUCME|nr:probable ubiquitin-conjugating enzyme E2 25 isoform X7 [Cucumis melo]
MIRRSSKMLKNKGVISLDVIDVDKDEASGSAMFIHQKFDANDKGKGVYHHGDHQLKDQNGNKTNIETSRTSWSTLAKPQSVPGSVNHLGKSTTQVQVKEVSNNLHLPADINVLNHLHPFGSFPPQDIQPNKKSASSRWDKHELHNGGETSDASYSVKKQVTSHSMPHPNFPESVDFIEYLGAGQSMPQWPEYAKTKTKEPFFPPHMASGFYGSFNPFVPPTLGEVVDVPWVQGSTQNLSNIAPNDSISEAIPPADKDKFLGNFESFKQFDTVDDHSDHHYATKGSSLNQASKKWTKKIQDDWKILQNDLPETIFVRVYESRMDLMRAVIIGAQGTPYHDGLFFFDIFFPPRYPDLPPQVYYHSKGLRLNPNLYNCGKVCLSLLNTWRGNGNENWVPGMSTMLQVLVSIQGLILNTKPYFNEPGYAYQSGSEAGENRSHMYNEETYILSIKTMLFNIKRPPKHFEDFVRGHFYKRAHDILVACKAYINGAQVGSLVEGGVQDLELSDKSCSDSFKQSVTHLLSQLVGAFKGIGVGDCDKYLQMLSPTIPNARKRPGRPVKIK